MHNICDTYCEYNVICYILTGYSMPASTLSCKINPKHCKTLYTSLWQWMTGWILETLNFSWQPTHLHCTICTVNCILYTIHFKLYKTVHCTVYTILVLKFNTHCTLSCDSGWQAGYWKLPTSPGNPFSYTVNFIVSGSQCTVYSV